MDYASAEFFMESPNPLAPTSTESVSVVIPCYRCAHTIRRAVDSVVAQTLKPVEIILVDDASGDDTLRTLEDISRSFAEGFIRVIPVPLNQGPGSARNRGWDVAQGELVAFLDSDDIWAPEKLSLQLAAMSENPRAVISGHLTAVWQGALAPSVVSRPLKVRPVGLSTLLFKNVFATRTVILRRDLRFRFKEGMRFSEDYLLWLEILASGAVGFVLPSVLAYSFKNDFGSGGLSSQMWRMEKGELQALQNLRMVRSISRIVIAIACIWSLARFIRRCLIKFVRDIVTPPLR